MCAHGQLLAYEAHPRGARDDGARQYLRLGYHHRVRRADYGSRESEARIWSSAARLPGSGIRTTKISHARARADDAPVDPAQEVVHLAYRGVLAERQLHLRAHQRAAQLPGRDKGIGGEHAGYGTERSRPRLAEQGRRRATGSPSSALFTPWINRAMVTAPCAS